MRVLILVTHLLGIGHLARARLLAEGLRREGVSVTLVSGGLPSKTISGAAGTAGPSWDFIQLPPVQIKGTDFGHLLDDRGRAADENWMAARRLRLLDAIRTAPPDILITEHFPFGRRQLSAEFLEAIHAARALNGNVQVIASVRDVLVAPDRTAKIDQAHQRIRDLFDLVLVHGDEAILPLSRSWPRLTEIAAKLRYTGYIATPTEDFRGGRGTDEILVSGGGSAAALPLFTCAVAAAVADPQARDWRILIGGGVGQETLKALQEKAESGHGRVAVEPARPDFPRLLAQCAVSVSMAGYNTMLDLVQAGRPAVVVPFDAGKETEQRLRAQAFGEAGFVELLDLTALTPQHLLAAIEKALQKPLDQRAKPDLDGLSNSVRLLKDLSGR